MRPETLGYLEYAGDNIAVVRLGSAAVAMLSVPVRGAAVYDDMIDRWEQVAQCQRLPFGDVNYRSSHIQLMSEPKNEHDPNAIKVLCKGEAYGKLGYVAKERTSDVRALSALSGVPIGELDCTIANNGDVGWRTVHIIITAPMR